MRRQVRVPIRVRRSEEERGQEVTEERKAPVESAPAAVEHGPAVTERRERVPARREAVSSEREEQEIEALKEELETWRDRALRLQAEIENFRKRQRRLAEERIESDRARLLRNFLMVADDLGRALNAGEGDSASLREGVELTQRSLHQLLKQEGADLVSAKGETFDPTWHEAVGTVPHEEVGVDRDTIVTVTQPGYQLDGRLLRPARVIVAR